ncbi:NosL family protein [Oryzomonas sagensis]|uniref:NosL family protein n=1 Tax=Oryzomonas sagensis TaxID=2603857 RepID=A0ABQ6TPX0_9BACT|nr:nitrous oxide reductase accessory protein NosL [Oryzomonas sagensis]KAB0670432.1 NosL family protein [Oryzomonas sagensis]
MISRILVILTFAIGAFACLAAPAPAQDDIREHRSCTTCGMDRKAYGYSRMLIHYRDGGRAGVCSLHCAVTELDANKRRPVTSILVADRDTRLLIDAGKAIWVIGGRKRGVMTQRPKWAFGTEAAARSFIAANGGTTANWAEALAAAQGEIAPTSH